jgi:hypothetical protein
MRSQLSTALKFHHDERARNKPGQIRYYPSSASNGSVTHQCQPSRPRKNPRSNKITFGALREALNFCREQPNAPNILHKD